jgi:glycosyltransferase involved in cell wall biosynthesis
VVIPNAIDLSEYQGVCPKEYRAKVIRLAYIGRLDLDKGLMEAVEAVRILVQERGLKDIEFVIAGSGPAEERLHSRIKEQGLSSYVKLIGATFGAAKMKFWREADILVFPSHHEGLPYTVLESLAAGTPVVASDVGGIPDAVEDGTHGILVKPHDARMLAGAIETLLCDRNRLRRMSAACIERARECYGIERLAQQVAGLYQEMLE